MFERNISYCPQRQSYIFSYPAPTPADAGLLARIEKARRQNLPLPVFFKDLEGPRTKGAIDFSQAEIPVTCGSIADPAYFSAGVKKARVVGIIKEANRSEVILPHCMDLTASATLLALDDFYLSFGRAAFYASEFTTLVHRGTVRPNFQLRPEFAFFHNHQKASDSLEMVYTCSSSQPTEFRISGVAKSGSPFAVERWNKYTMHRSRTNEEPEPVDRTWLALTSRLRPEGRVRPTERLMTIVNPAIRPEELTQSLREFHGASVQRVMHRAL